MNLGTNAVQAMPRGGTLTFSLRVAGAPDPELVPGEEFGSEKAVVLEVEDTGTGMDAETVARIFDPFFTTKEPGAGTGLGLSVVHGIVRSHGGIIDVRTHPGEGTCFAVYLPASARDRTDEPEDVPARGGTERILVVDDQEEVLVALSRTLRALGYEPVAAATAEAALSALDGEGADAALLDFDMPDMSGSALARQLRDRVPGLPVILISGSHQDEEPENLEGHRSLLKPVGRYELDAALREVLGGEPLIVPDDDAGA
jgi:CheY-like chemotaxis protein